MNGPETPSGAGTGPGPERPAGAPDVERTGTDAERTEADAPRPPRPMVERIGLAAIALLFVVLFGAAAAAAWHFGEPFLAAMAAIGCLMTAWVGGLSLLRG